MKKTAACRDDVGRITFNATAAETIRFALPPPTRRSNRWTPTTRSSASISIWPTRCARQMQAQCTFTNQAFDSLIAALKFKKYDAVISGMDITPERSKQVAFTQPYYANSAIVIAQKGKVQLAGGSEGKKLGMENGTPTRNTCRTSIRRLTPSLTTATRTPFWS